MATYYFDTSALVKLYVAEPGSGWVDHLVNALGADGRPEHVIALSRIALVEVAAAVARRGRLRRPICPRERAVGRHQGGAEARTPVVGGRNIDQRCGDGADSPGGSARVELRPARW